MVDPSLNPIAWWVPLAAAAGGAVFGYAFKALEDWLQHRRVRAREREARAEARSAQQHERRVTFQRQTLLDLQDTLQQLVRFSSATHSERAVALMSTGDWRGFVSHRGENKTQENKTNAQARSTVLAVRVRDDAVRDGALRLKQAAARLSIAGSREESEEALEAITNEFRAINLRIGELLRTLDDEEAG